MLTRLESATGPKDMDAPGWKPHPLKGELVGRWAVWEDGNWRLTFAFEGKDAGLGDWQDSHYTNKPWHACITRRIPALWLASKRPLPKVKRLAKAA